MRCAADAASHDGLVKALLGDGSRANQAIRHNAPPALLAISCQLEPFEVDMSILRVSRIADYDSVASRRQQSVVQLIVKV